MAAITPFYFFLIAGVVLICAELLIFQLSVFWLLFVGVGALQASLVVWLMGSESWVLATAVFVSTSAVIAALLYRPLTRWQAKPSALGGNSAIGQQVTVLETIAPNQTGKVHWSGVDWPAQLAVGETVTLNAGSVAIIARLEGIRLVVKAP